MIFADKKSRKQELIHLNGMMYMQDRKEKEWYSESEIAKKEKRAISRLVIEDNTIYEIDLECQYRKKQNNDACKWCKKEKGV